MSEELENGLYHLYSPNEKTPVLAKLYDCTDAGCRGFGFLR